MSALYHSATRSQEVSEFCTVEDDVGDATLAFAGNFIFFLNDFLTVGRAGGFGVFLIGFFGVIFF